MKINIGKYKQEILITDYLPPLRAEKKKPSFMAFRLLNGWAILNIVVTGISAPTVALYGRQWWIITMLWVIASFLSFFASEEYDNQ